MLCYRVVYAFGKRIREPVQDITPTYLSQRVLGVLRECDSVASSVLEQSGKRTIVYLAPLSNLDTPTLSPFPPRRSSAAPVAGEMRRLSQMPLVLLPLHFDRDPLQHVPSCQHSVVIRSFVTNDFMTGTAAQPGVQISEQVHRPRPGRGGPSRSL